MYVFIKPVGDLLVPDQRSKEGIPVTGVLVELNSYWQRRIIDGTVVVCDQTVKQEVTDKKDKGGNK